MVPGFPSAFPDILLLFGTQTGNAEAVAYSMAEALEAEGFTVHLLDMADAYPELLADYHQLLVCISTWGEGELPDNAIDFYEAIEMIEPDLSHLIFGIVALGDHYYDPHFCAAGKLMRQRLSQFSAAEVYAMLEIDTGSSAEDLEAVRAWAHTCAAAFRHARKEEAFIRRGA